MGEPEDGRVERLAAEPAHERRKLGVERRRPAPSIGAVADDGGSQMGEVHADLVRAPRPEGGLDQRQGGRDARTGRRLDSA